MLVIWKLSTNTGFSTILRSTNMRFFCISRLAIASYYTIIVDMGRSIREGVLTEGVLYSKVVLYFVFQEAY